MGDPVGYFTKTTLHRSICMLKFYICFYIYMMKCVRAEDTI